MPPNLSSPLNNLAWMFTPGKGTAQPYLSSAPSGSTGGKKRRHPGHPGLVSWGRAQHLATQGHRELHRRGPRCSEILVASPWRPDDRKHGGAPPRKARKWRRPRRYPPPERKSAYRSLTEAVAGGETKSDLFPAAEQPAARLSHSLRPPPVSWSPYERGGAYIGHAVRFIFHSSHDFVVQHVDPTSNRVLLKFMNNHHTIICNTLMSIPGISVLLHPEIV